MACTSRQEVQLKFDPRTGTGTGIGTNMDMDMDMDMGKVDRMTHPLYSCGFSPRDRPTDTARWPDSGNALAGSSAQGLADAGGSADHPPCPHP